MMTKNDIFDKKILREFKIGLIEILNYVENRGTVLRKNKREYIQEIIILVTNTIKKYNELSSYPKIDIDEIIGEVYETLLKAGNVDTSKYKGGYESYAKVQIKKNLEVLLLKERYFRFTELPYNINNLINRCLNIITYLTNKLGRTPTPDSIAFILDKDIDDIDEALVTFNKIRHATNIDLHDKSTYIYSHEYKIENNLKQLILSLLDKTKLTETELYSILLFYGIILENNKLIQYNNQTIILDGITKNLTTIGELLSLTKERVRKVLISALYKLETNDEIISLGLIDYTNNPDLVLRMKDIYNWTKDIPFTDKYPNFNSYFKEYSAKEIQEILNELDATELNFIRNLEEFDKKVVAFKYATSESKNLFTLIQKIYISLIQKYGRRSMTTELTPSYTSYYGNEINKLRDFYQIFSNYDKDIVVYLLLN